MLSRLINFSTLPEAEPANGHYAYWWNAPRHQSILGFERPLTRERMLQGQAILADIDALPRILRYPYQKRYEKVLKEQGILKAQDFLYFDFHQKFWPRIAAVTRRFEMDTPATLSATARLSAAISQFNRLPDLHNKQLKALANQIAAGFFNLFEQYCDQCIARENGDKAALYRMRNLHPIYGELAKIALGLHVTPVYYQRYLKGKLTAEHVVSAVARLVNDDFWYRRLKAHRTRWREALLIAVMAVNKNRSPYASRQAIQEVKSQRLSNLQYLQAMDIEDVETGERFDLVDQVMQSIANPEIRRMEMMAQVAGIQRVALARNDIGMFVTITTPSKYHPTRLMKKGGAEIAVLNHNWADEAYTPKDGQRYLVRVWSKIRTAFKDSGLNVYGVRVVEPHHDGTPHWHLLLFTDKASRAAAVEIMRKKALQEDGDERGAQKYRFECKHMNRGGAVSYIAKYIAKNIDGYALKGQIDHETGKPLTDAAAAVTAWASTWRIPQFQFYNLPSKGAYRECRRLRSINIADQLGEVAEKVRAAADIGDFENYILSQGGPCTPRDQQTLRVARELADKTNPYDEAVSQVVGIYAQLNPNAGVLKTREREYRIVKKRESHSEASDQAGAGLGFDLLKSPIGAPRSPVNNCGSGYWQGLENSPYLPPTLSGKALSDVLQWGWATEINAAENGAQREEIGVSGQRVISRITLTSKEEALLPDVMNFTASMGCPISNKSMAMMFVKGMSISLDGQVMQFADGEVRLMETEDGREQRKREFNARKEARRDALRQRINKIGEMRKL
ncbi:replication endonuclease [Xenorhabdus sp. DI]|uniref:replication endonuclease n=1 Tax=Xenorhabdus doucetiae TaxID=351671 RepID=UPI0019B20BD2|nr:MULTISPECIES: replication endonuclease [unclassified Xenorhabdus]MBD2785957.1 replication endonuclease [Xenorhabdus sp. 3]MBD2790236.1 replication endonuclease [Xenorhabdus sp. DI]